MAGWACIFTPMNNYLVINDNGDAFRVTPTNADTYADLSALVDGYIEAVSLPGGVVAWVNEEGLFRQDFALNLVGSLIALQWTGYAHKLVGPVVFAGEKATSSGNITVPCPEGFILNETVNNGLVLTPADGSPYHHRGEWSVAECAARMAESRRIYMEARA